MIRLKGDYLYSETLTLDSLQAAETNIYIYRSLPPIRKKAKKLLSNNFVLLSCKNDEDHKKINYSQLCLQLSLVIFKAITFIEFEVAYDQMSGISQRDSYPTKSKRQLPKQVKETVTQPSCRDSSQSSTLKTIHKTFIQYRKHKTAFI